MVRRATPRRIPWLAIKLWAVAVLASVPGVLVVALSWNFGAGAMIGGAVTLALMGAALAGAVHVLVTSPLRMITADIQRIAAGDCARRRRVSGDAEITAIARALENLGGRLERRLAATHGAERRHRLLYEHSPAGMFRTRLDGAVVEGNAAAARLLDHDGLTALRAQNTTAFYADPRDSAMVIEHLRRHGVLAGVPFAFRRQDGATVPVLLTLVQTQESGETYLDAIVVPTGCAREADGPSGASVEEPSAALVVR